MFETLDEYGNNSRTPVWEFFPLTTVHKVHNIQSENWKENLFLLKWLIAIYKNKVGKSCTRNDCRHVCVRYSYTDDTVYKYNVSYASEHKIEVTVCLSVARVQAHLMNVWLLRCLTSTEIFTLPTLLVWQ